MAFTSYPWANVHELNLDWLIKTMKEIDARITEVEDYRAEFEHDILELTNQVNAMGVAVENITHLYNTFSEDILKQFNQLSADINLQYLALSNDLNAQFDALESVVNIRLGVFSTRLDNLETELTNVLSNLPQVIKMISPYTGEEETLQNIIYEIANAGREDALTATEYDALDLTATAFEAYDITAYEYDFSGKTILV